MSNSKLVSYIDTTTTNWNDRKYPITRITIHHAAGVCTMSSFSSILKSGRECSWNYAIANDGTIGLFVEENHRAWTSSNGENDHRAITIEVSNSSTGGDWPVSSAAYSSLLNLCEDICRRNNISKLTYTGKLEGSNLTMHQWFAATACPGPYLKSKFSEIASTVNTRLGSASSLSYVTNTEVVGTSAYDSATYGGVSVAPSMIDTTKIDEFLITIDRTVKNINYAALKSIGVMGVVVEGGYLYNSVHQIQPYRNPNLFEQISNIEANGLPYGLYFDIKSRSTEEANKELYYLSLCLRKYSPLLGVWLRLKMNNNKSTNHSIVDLYYKQLIKLGLNDKIGFYVTKSELNKIDWSKYKDSFYLWIDSHIDSVDNLDELLTPQFFVVN